MQDEKEYFYLPREQLEENWESSFGLDLSKDHYREKPPGTGHAICEPGDDICKVHYDKYNPHEHLLRHLIEDEPNLLDNFGPAITSAIETYDETDSYLKAIKAALATGVSFFVCIYRGTKIGLSFFKKEFTKL